MTAGGRFALALLPLLALGAALAVALQAGLADDATDLAPPDAARSAAPPASPAADPPAANPVDAWFATILARPLFEPDRRPPTVRSPPAEVEVPRLIGVMVSPTSRVAIFAGASGGKPLVVAEGGQVGGHVVQSIQPGEATLAGPRGQRTLHPFARDSGAAPTGGADRR
jgi:general secretion pathway protein N